MEKLKNFCALPFTQFTVSSFNEYQLCCDNLGESKMFSDKYSILEYFNSDYINDKRTAFLNNRKLDICKACWDREDKGLISRRIVSLKNIKYNEQLIKPDMTFREFAEKAWKLPDNCYDNHYPCQVHGIGMCDEWPFIAYPDKDYSNGDYSGVFEENMVICVESYIGEVGEKEGVKLEDQYLITKNGLKLLTNYPLNQI